MIDSTPEITPAEVLQCKQTSSGKNRDKPQNIQRQNSSYREISTLTIKVLHILFCIRGYQCSIKAHWQLIQSPGSLCDTDAVLCGAVTGLYQPQTDVSAVADRVQRWLG